MNFQNINQNQQYQQNDNNDDINKDNINNYNDINNNNMSNNNINNLNNINNNNIFNPYGKLKEIVYSFKILERNLETYTKIISSENEIVNLEFTIINNSTNSFPGNTKLVFFKNNISNIKEYYLRSLQPGQKEKININFPENLFFGRINYITVDLEVEGKALRNPTSFTVINKLLAINEFRKEYNLKVYNYYSDENIINALKDNGVNSMLQIIKGDKTSRCGVGIYKKEKLFVTQIRASKRLSGEYIEENLERILAHQILIIEGYLMKNKFDVCEKLCEYFSNRKKMIILTLSASFIPKYYNENLIKIANKSDIIAGSMEEAKELAGNEGKTPDEIFANIFKKLTPKDNRLLVITDGANGAFCAKYDYHNDKMEYIVQTFANTLKDEEIQDLNGAGDAFLGGFLSEFMKGYSICDCLKNGIEAASVILKNVGCTFPKNQNFLIK